VADDDGYMLNERTIRRLAKLVKDYLGRSHNTLPDVQRQRFGGLLVYPFINDSDSTAPHGAIMAVSASPRIDTAGSDIIQAVYKCTIPSTTFYSRYAVNINGPVDAGKSGLCCFEGPVWIKYDTGTPARGEGWGPKPGQWTLSKGFPATTLVDGIVDSTNKLLLGTLAPITTLLGKTTGAITANSASTSYQIWTGTLGSEANGGFTTVPSALSRVAIDSGKFVKLTWHNNGWIMEPLECNA